MAHDRAIAMRAVAIALFATAGSSGASPPELPRQNDPEKPVVLVPAKDGFRGKDHLLMSIDNRSDEGLSLQGLIRLDRSEGDGTWTPVFNMRVATACPPGDARETPAPACITMPARSRWAIPAWDFYGAGLDQCPPRPPGVRAFKGIYRATLSPCPTAPAVGAQAKMTPAVVYLTWE